MNVVPLIPAVQTKPTPWKWTGIFVIAAAFAAGWFSRPMPKEQLTSKIPEKTFVSVPLSGSSTNQFFSWEQIESADYKQYIENMRRIGVPPATITDIISADIRAYYQPRIDRLVEEYKKRLSYWEIPRPGEQNPELAKNLREILEQKAFALKELVGQTIDVLAELNRLIEGSSDRASFVAPERREAFAAADRKYRRESGNLSSADGPRQIEEAQIKREAEIQAVLSPEEFAAWNQRYSRAATTIRSHFRTVKLSEEEYLRLVSLQQQLAVERQRAMLQVSDVTDSVSLPRWDLTNEEIASVISEENFRKYTETYAPGFDINVNALSEK